MQTRVVGVSVPRKEGPAKLTGQARYIDDLSLPGMIFGATVRSTIARGAIEEIRFGEGIPWHEFTIVTAKDIPGRNIVSLIMDDQPCLADGMVNHPEEPILLLAHPDRHALAAAVAAVKITYKPAPSIHSIEESERREHHHLGQRQHLQKLPDGKRRCRPGVERCGLDCRRRIHHRSPGTALYRTQWSHRPGRQHRRVSPSGARCNVRFMYTKLW